MPIQRQDNRFTKVPQIYGNWVDCLKYLAKLQPFDNNIRAVAQPTLSYMKRISLVSYTYGFRLWPGMVIWIYAARMGKRAGMPLNWILLVFTFFFWKCYTIKGGKKQNRRLYPTKNERFFDVWFPTATQAYSNWNSSRPNSNIFLPEQTGAIATNGCVTLEDKSMKWIGKSKKNWIMWDSLGKPRNRWKCIDVI